MKFPGNIFQVLFLLSFFAIGGCRNHKPDEKDIVKKPEQLEDRVRLNMNEILKYTESNKGALNDSVSLAYVNELKAVYDENGYAALWSAQGIFLPAGDSLYAFITDSRKYGLFPKDYHFPSLSAIYRQLSTDSLARKDAALLSRSDIMLTDAMLRISRDLKRGRLPYDSLTSRKDTLLDEHFYLDVLQRALKSGKVIASLHELEPRLAGYQDLKSGIAKFLDSANFNPFTILPYPIKDTLDFNQLLQKRLVEERLIATPGADTAALRRALMTYQTTKKIKSTGKINETTVNSLNDTDWERFKRIAISLDKYKLMPDTLPATYVWVNIPSYQLKLIDTDTISLESRVIVGTPRTRTPELNSEISNFITYPQWTVPYSIVFKEMLPQIQRNIDYLRKQNLMVVDRYDSVIDPAKIDWSKLSKKKFPYQIKQREGDDNSLGVLKFNFRNPYSVYLHDTNARWMFSKTSRALSHGCVRVQNYRNLANFLVRNDSIRYHPDTLSSWISRQEKHMVSGFKKVPIFIRYFTCEGRNGKVRFYDDIYAEDRLLAQKYFSKNIN